MAGDANVVRDARLGGRVGNDTVRGGVTVEDDSGLLQSEILGLDDICIDGQPMISTTSKGKGKDAQK